VKSKLLLFHYLITKIHFFKFSWKVIVIFAVFLISTLIYFFIVSKPSNNRNWQYGFEVLPSFHMDGDLVYVRNIRNTRFDEYNKPNISYFDDVYDSSKITKVWFVYEPFKVKPFTFFNGIAHTYLVFDFSNHSPVAVSVEARREKGETYDAWVGMFNQYELIYVWGTEEDETIRRVAVEKNKLYMYPLTISKENSKRLFLQLAKTSQELEANPRFYNSLTANCTNELAKAANKLQKDFIPFNISWIFPGYSIEELYKLGLLPKDKSLEELETRFYISPVVEEVYKDQHFSKTLRTNLEEF
jgi:hypothetical protein